MKNKMKNSLKEIGIAFGLLLAMIFALLAPQVRADSAPGVTATQSYTFSSTNQLNTNGTQTLLCFGTGVFIDCSRQANIAVEADVTGGTGSSNQTFYFCPSVVSGKYDSNQVKTLTVAEPGTAPPGGVYTNSGIITLTNGGYNGWYMTCASNASSVNGSTNVITALIKTQIGG